MTSQIDIPDISDPHVMALSAFCCRLQSYTKSKKMSKKQGLKWNGNAVVDFLNITKNMKFCGTRIMKTILKKSQGAQF